MLRQTCAHDAHRDDRGHRYGISRVFGFFSRSGDTVEPDVRVKTSGGARDDTGRAVGHETAVSLPVFAVSVVKPGDDDDGHHA